MVPKLDPKELELKDSFIFGRPVKVPNYPLSQHDNEVLAFQRKPWWMAKQAMDTCLFTPTVIPDCIARALVFEGKPFDMANAGGPDMFGIDWEYVPSVGGSMVRPGDPFLDDITEWYDKVVWPDVDSWDWEGSAAINEGKFLQPQNFNQIWFYSGYFERLISMLDFEEALMAIAIDDYKEDVHAFFTKLTDLYIDIFDHIHKYFPSVNAVFFHDDWGSQKDAFFSPALCEEMIVPYMRRLTDHLHSLGIFCEIHSCGNNIKQVPNYIKAGWDLWAPQLMNDCYEIYDKYGDQISIATFPMNMPEEVMSKPTDAEKGAAFAALPEEQQRQIARDFVNRVCTKEKPSFFNFYAAHFLTPAFSEEMYKQSRMNMAD